LNVLHDAGISGGGGATEQVVLSPQMHMLEPPLVEMGGPMSAVTTTCSEEDGGGPVFGMGAVGAGVVDTMERTSSLFNALGCDYIRSTTDVCMTCMCPEMELLLSVSVGEWCVCVMGCVQ